jgi:hypothetical protein
MRKHKLILSIGIFVIFIPFCKKEQIKNHQPSKIEQNNQHSEDKFFFSCPPGSRKADFCLEVYEPVCGWFTEKPSECNSIYCRESYANQCFACKDNRVIGYTKGKCKN